MEAAIQECGLQENGVDVPLMQGILSVQKKRRSHIQGSLPVHPAIPVRRTWSRFGRLFA